MENRSALAVPALGLILLAAVAGVPLFAQAPTRPTQSTFSLGGMIAATAQGRFDVFEPFFSLRAVPRLDVSLPAGRGWTFDGEASANLYGTLFFPRHAKAETSGALKPYRGWLRLSSSRFEARLGLQQLSFGSATLFRPLMWFDSLDPRDPLRLTDGVYGLLLRFYAKGNANAWAWGLIGNSERRGFDLAPPSKRSPEFGGRVEVPLFRGEIAATFHHRKADINGLSPVMSPLVLSASGRTPPLSAAFSPSELIPRFAAPRAEAFPSASPVLLAPVPEDRFGLDGKWDIGIGVWAEAALIHQGTPFLPRSYQRACTLGADTTLSLGRGLTALVEHFRIESAVRAFAAGDSLSFTALLLRYPLGILDELSGIFYYDWKNRGVYRFVGWTRRTDTITFSAIAFSNPAELAVFQGVAGSGSFAGTGLELILAYYF